MSLINYGLDRYRSRSSWSPTPGEIVGRIVSASRGVYRVALDAAVVTATLTGTLRDSLTELVEQPAIGDWVVVSGEPAGSVRITSILPRTTLLTRKDPGRTSDIQPLVANADVVCITGSLDSDRNHHGRSFERYVTAVWESGAVPLVVLNKADTCDDLEAARAETEEAVPGVEVLTVSCLTGEGIEAFAARLAPQSTTAFVGKSGVGKSSLINALAAGSVAGTGEVRSVDGKGRHTTTSRDLLLLPSGLLVVDTPGMREFAPSAGGSSLDTAFEEIADLSGECRFGDCSHSGEPGCAVRAAIERGDLDQGRFESYLHLKKELAYLESKSDDRIAQAREARYRAIARQSRRFKKDKRV